MAHWRLFRCVLIVSGVLLASVPTPSPAHAAHEDWVALSGAVWLDENVDGIRQPSEPLLSGVIVEVSGTPIPNGSTTTDEQGYYTYDPGRPRDYERKRQGSIIAFVHYTKPGAEQTFSAGYYYSHYGCASPYVLPEDEGAELTLNIRVLHFSHRGLSPPFNWPLADGHFFTEASGDRSCDHGYPVTNAAGIPFWDTWQRMGLENVGYPLSDRFMWRGLITQLFQKAIFQGQPGKRVSFVNIFDQLHHLGADDEHLRYFGTPKRLDSSFDAGKSREEIQRDRLALLNANSAIKERYYAAAEPLRLYGLPTSRVVEYPNVSLLRTQKVVFQHWNEDVLFAKAGEVTIVNGGYAARRYDFFPWEVLEPRSPESVIGLP